MTIAGVWRALSPSEGIQAVREAWIGYTVRTAGRLDLDALATAYEAVYRSYPQLTARLADSGSDAEGPVFVAADGTPEIQVCDGDPDRPLTGANLDQTRQLSAVNVVRDGDEASVCLLTHHGIADAGHAMELLAALWSCYTDVVEDVPVDLPHHPYPRSLEDLLAERGIHGGGSTPRLPAKPPAAGPARHVVQLRLTEEQTAALVALGRREQVTINGLLAGALLLVEARLREVPVTELMYRFTVNLRGHLTPPVGATEGTNILGGAGFVATADLEPHPVAIGRAVSTQLRAGLADGSIQRSLLDLLSRPAPDAKPWDPSAAPAVVSMINWGVVPPLRTPDGLALTNFYSASRIREVAALGGYVVHTFDGRLGIDLAWPEGDPELPRRIECLRAQLGRMTDAQSWRLSQ